MRVRISNHNGKRRLVLVLTLLLVAILVPVSGAHAAPPNDDFDSAVAITALPYTNVVLANDATSDATDPYCFGGGRTVWYSFTAGESGRISVDTLESNYDTTLGVYTGTEGSLTEVACQDNFGWRKKSLVRFDAQAGIKYHIMVGSLATGTRGTLRFHVDTAPPRAVNDEEPTTISSIPFSETVDVSESTASSTDPNCFRSAQTVWYSYTPAKAIRLEADTSASDWDTIVGVYEGKDLKRVLCTDNSTARFEAKAGKTYLVMVGTFYDEPGDDLVFSLREAPPAMKLEAQIPAQGRVAALTGAARLKFRVKCSVDARAYLSGRVKQRQGNRIVAASFAGRVKCEPTWRKRSLTAEPGGRAFRDGKALVTLRANASTQSEWTQMSTKRVIRLR